MMDSKLFEGRTGGYHAYLSRSFKRCRVANLPNSLTIWAFSRRSVLFICKANYSIKRNFSALLIIIIMAFRTITSLTTFYYTCTPFVSAVTTLPPVLFS